MNRRLLGYLLINIFVSAAVIIAILIFYDRHFRPSTPPLPDSSTQGVVEIAAIAAVGQLDKEAVTIRNSGQASLSLDGWALQDASGAQYVFPELTLLPGGSVIVHTAAGDDTATDLYWSLTEPVWSSGELATLSDTGGTARAVYRIP